MWSTSVTNVFWVTSVTTLQSNGGENTTSSKVMIQSCKVWEIPFPTSSIMQLSHLNQTVTCPANAAIVGTFVEANLPLEKFCTLTSSLRQHWGHHQSCFLKQEQTPSQPLKASMQRMMSQSLVCVCCNLNLLFDEVVCPAPVHVPVKLLALTALKRRTLWADE